MTVDRARIEKALSEFMDAIPELEGVIAFDSSASVISGQMLAEGIEQSQVASDVLALAKNAAALAKRLGKGKIVELSIRTPDGYILVMGQSNVIISAVVGAEARMHLGLVMHELASALNKSTESSLPK